MSEPYLQEADAEFSLIYGLLVMDHDYVDRVRKHAQHGDFASAEYNDLYQAVCALRDEGIESHVFDLADWLVDHRKLTRVSWTGSEALRYMKTIIAEPMPPDCALPEPLAKRVHRLAQERQMRNAMLQACQETGEAFHNACLNVRRVMDELEAQRLHGIANAWSGIEGWCADQAEVAAGDLIRTGWNDLDQRLGPLRRGELVILAARSGVGKTFSCQSIGEANLRQMQTGSVLLIEQEMAAAEVGGRLAAAVQEINPTRLRHDTIDLAKLREHAPHLDRLMICDRPVAIPEIPLLIREASRISPCKLVIIDYLGLLLDHTSARTTYDRVSQQVQALKHLARRANLVVVCVCQLNRKAEYGETEPDMHMLRDAGTIEENADRVLLMWRIEKSLDVMAKIAKNRFGTTGYRRRLTFTSGMRLVEA